MDNVFIEWLKKSVKYEDIYLKAYSTMTEAKKGLAGYFTFYNEKRMADWLFGFPAGGET